MARKKLKFVRPYPVMGAQDAASLTAVAAGIFTAMPMMAGNLIAGGAGLAAAFAGGAGLAFPRMARRFDRVDEDADENFVLSSDNPVAPDLNRRNSVLIGYTKDTNEPVRVPYDLFMRHMALIGASGVGKTTLGMFVIYQQIMAGGGILFIDAKIDVDTRDSLAYFCKMAGREDDLLVVNVDRPDRSNTYNPILAGDPDEIASRLLNLLPSSENDPGSDFYRQSANHALVSIVGALQACGFRFHFGDLTILLQSADAMEFLLRQTPNGPERMALEVFLDKYRKVEGKDRKAKLDVNKMKDVLGGMAGRMALFAQGKFGKVFNTYTPEVVLVDAIRENKIVYFMLPTMGKDTAALNLGKMAISDLRSATSIIQSIPKAYRPNPPFLCFLDEFGSYVMPGIARLFEQARSAQIAIVPGFQAFGNLREVSPDFADIILQNTWNKVFYRFGGADSAEAAADIIGKVKRLQYTIASSKNSGESAQFIQSAPQQSESESGGFGESWREMEEYRVTPGHLAGLGIGECVLTIARRAYHLRVPRLTTPIDDRDQLRDDKSSEMDDALTFVPRRYRLSIPSGERPLNLEKQYRRFMIGGDEDLAEMEEGVA